MRFFLIIIVFLMISCHHPEGNLSSYYNSDPVIRTDHPDPTADKPQSKLWYMYDRWWAMLPRSSGPSLWQRTEQGWIEYKDVSEALKGIPGRTDVWSEGKVAIAAGVANNSLTIFQMTFSGNSRKISCTTKIHTELFPPDANDLIETATISKDGEGILWVAAVAGSKVCVWHSSEGIENWSSPLILAEGLDQDDICVVTRLPGAIGVIWSDQVREAVLIRSHKDGDHGYLWENEKIIEIGNKTADDHLNTYLTSDGTLWLITKNSVDQIGKPQFVLRIRPVNGKWINKPLVNLESSNSPTRPVIYGDEANSSIFIGFTDSDRSKPFPYGSKIIFSEIDTTLSCLLANKTIVISPDTANKSFINNVTGPKNSFPRNAPWIILASDQNGNVYEADLHKMIVRNQ